MSSPIPPPGYDGYNQPYPPTQPGYGQPYYPPPQENPGFSHQPPPNEETPIRVQNKDTKFEEKPEYKDVCYLILYLVHLVIIFGLLVYGIVGPKKEDEDDNNNNNNENDEDGDIFDTRDAVVVGLLLLAACGIGFLASVLLLVLIQRNPKQFIYFSIFSTLFLMFAYGIFVAYFSLVGGIIIIFFALIWCFLFFLWRKKIPFAAAVLSSVIAIVRKYPATLHLGYFSLLAQILWNAFWIVTVVLLLRLETTPGYIMAVFLVFSYYWTSQVLKNIVHVTISGTVATWYFMGDSAMPKNPTAKSFRRATTYSLGSICLGSLLVALIKTLRAIVRSMRNDRNALLVCLIDCILGCLDSLLRYFNHYAFVYVAMYGYTFWQAAKATFRMFEETGLMAIVNDNIIGTVLTMSCLLSGIATGTIVGILGWVLLHGSAWLLVGLVGLVIGFTLTFQAMEVIDSGVATIFVAFAEDPLALKRHDPNLHNTFITTYGGNLKMRT